MVHKEGDGSGVWHIPAQSCLPSWLNTKGCKCTKIQTD